MSEIRLQGIAASCGIAVGPAYCYTPVNLSIPERRPDSPEQEMARFESACAAARAELAALRASVAERSGNEEEAAIFDAHLEMLVGLGVQLMERVSTGLPLVLDGAKGMVVLEPESSTVQGYQSEKQKQATRMEVVKQRARQEARSANGRRVEVAANIGEVETAREAVEYGAEGVGLLRTEFLYLNDANPPGEEKQMHIYRQIFEALGDRPVIVRTLDIGGDKPLSYLHFNEELNPFLGWRAIRICLDDTDLFKTQLRAILRAAVGYPARIMFPMISGLEELRCARETVRAVERELAAEGLPFAENVPVGIMVETPAAAVLVDVLSEAADFFSLGTNDLTQYTLAVDRGNPQVARLFQPLHPAVLRLIQQTISAAHAKGKWVGMCGELAGMPKAIPILLGMGLDEFSMAARAIPEAKGLLSRLDDERARQIAARALALGTAEEIEALMGNYLHGVRIITGLGEDANPLGHDKSIGDLRSQQDLKAEGVGQPGRD